MMGRDDKQVALVHLLEHAEKQGYITFDDIMDCADIFSLPIQDFDWLSNEIITSGIILYDEAPENHILSDQETDDYDDYAQIDYEAIYDRIIELNDRLEPLITEIRNIKPPQRNEFLQLKYHVLEGNQHARERMIEMYLRVALRIALQRTEIYDMDIQDAVSEAFIGLVMAVDKYNPDENGAFARYASMWILQNISRRQETQRPLMYYPVNRKELYFSAYPVLKKAGYIGDLNIVNDSDVYELIGKKFSFTKEQIEVILNAAVPFESFEKLYSASFEKYYIFEDEVEDCLPKELIMEDFVETEIIKNILKEQLSEVLATLSEREQKILKLRFGFVDGEEKTLEYVGKECYITRERVRQIELKALQKLRYPSRSRKLKDYVNFLY